MALVVDSFELFIKESSKVVSEHWTNFVDVITIIGAWYAFRFAVDVGYHTVIHFKRAFSKPRNFVKDYGRWAIVTGCTSGIGRQFCRQLADRGLNIVLVARNANLCNKQARILEKTFGVRTITLIHDFTTATFDDYSAISDTLRDKEVGILVNNAGVHYDHPMQFSEVPSDKILSITQVNMAGVAMLTRTILPIMIARKRGLIINISSGAGWQPFPFISLYSASKAFVSHFSTSLELEVRKHNICVQALEPMYVATRMTKFSNFLTCTNPDAKSYVSSALKSLGRTTQTTAYYSHTLQMLVIKWCPQWIVTKASSMLQQYLMSEGMKRKLKED